MSPSCCFFWSPSSGPKAGASVNTCSWKINTSTQFVTLGESHQMIKFLTLARITNPSSIDIVGNVRMFCTGNHINMLPDMLIRFTEEGVEIAQAGLLACICLLHWSSTDPISCQDS